MHDNTKADIKSVWFFSVGEEVCASVVFIFLALKLLAATCSIETQVVKSWENASHTRRPAVMGPSL